jgi:phosphate starvation-inducible protein PhoH
MSRTKDRRKAAPAPRSHQVIEEREPKLKVKPQDLATVEPITENQAHFFNLFRRGFPAFMLHGVAGTGKTYIAVYNALKEVLREDTPYERVVIVRSAVPSRDIGHLPGDENEKSDVFTQPYVEMLADLLPRFGSQAFKRLQEQKLLTFMITSYVRGLTLKGSIVIVDEAQNLNDMELNSILTRVGEDTKIIFCGDFRQTDLQKRHDMSGLSKFMGIIAHMESFRMIEFGVQDIVRSALVKEWIIARMEYEDLHQG